MQAEAFKPQGKEVTVFGNGSPQLGGGGLPVMAQRDPRAGQPITDFTRGQQPTISAKTQIPQGAQAVTMAGPRRESIVAPNPHMTPVPMAPQAQEQPGTPIPPKPTAQQPILGQRPFMQRATPTNEQVYRVTLEGIGPDGTPLVAEYDAVFPAGTNQLGTPVVRQL